MGQTPDTLADKLLESESQIPSEIDLKKLFPRLQAIHGGAQKSEFQYIVLFTGQAGLPTVATFEKKQFGWNSQREPGTSELEWKFYGARAPTALDLKLLGLKIQVVKG